MYRDALTPLAGTTPLWPNTATAIAGLVRRHFARPRGRTHISAHFVLPGVQHAAWDLILSWAARFVKRLPPRASKKRDKIDVAPSGRGAS